MCWVSRVVAQLNKINKLQRHMNLTWLSSYRLICENTEVGSVLMTEGQWAWWVSFDYVMYCGGVSIFSWPVQKIEKYTCTFSILDMLPSINTIPTKYSWFSTCLQVTRTKYISMYAITYHLYHDIVCFDANNAMLIAILRMSLWRHIRMRSRS